MRTAKNQRARRTKDQTIEALPLPPEGPRSKPKIPYTKEGRDAQLIAATFDLAERQIADGTVSAQVMTHFLKLGSKLAELELERIKHETVLLTAKTEALKSGKQYEELLNNGLAAWSKYANRNFKDDG